MEDDDRPLLRSEPAEGALELVPGGDGARHVGRGGFDMEDPDARGRPPLAAGLAVAGVDHETVEPRVEALGIAKQRSTAAAASDANAS
jgi:hypothetical protein